MGFRGDITSGGIHQSQPIERHKSFLESSTAQLSAYVAAASDPAGSPASHQHQQQQQPQSLAHSGHQHTGKWEEPYFDDTTPRNVTALVGKSAYLSCRVKNLGNKTVSWIRHRDIHILTVGSYTYTSDQRFQATHHKSNDDWTLQIKWAQKRDAGLYECQISTQPVRSYFVTLSVVGKNEATDKSFLAKSKVKKDWPSLYGGRLLIVRVNFTFENLILLNQLNRSLTEVIQHFLSKQNTSTGWWIEMCVLPR
uniref:Ig-like domain-containing protein n=1 Tax=Anopheles albimanus TaxID=7167 RepID=A0A182FUH9_ANOAL